MKKIAIIGISGTGKSTTAGKLSDVLNIPVTHYDEFVWDKNWTEIDEKIVEQKIEEAVKKDEWIIEWYIHPAGEVRLRHADIVLYLDYSGPQAMWGGLQRWWRYRGKTRPEMAEGCIEDLNLTYLKVMWDRAERLEIEKTVKGFEEKIIRLKSRRETNEYIRKILKQVQDDVKV